MKVDINDKITEIYTSAFIAFLNRKVKEEEDKKLKL